MICGEVCTEKLKKIVYVGSGPILYFCFTMAAYAVYKHYTNYKSPNHQEKIIVISLSCFVIGIMSLLGSLVPTWYFLFMLIRGLFLATCFHLLQGLLITYLTSGSDYVNEGTLVQYLMNKNVLKAAFPFNFCCQSQKILNEEIARSSLSSMNRSIVQFKFVMPILCALNLIYLFAELPDYFFALNEWFTVNSLFVCFYNINKFYLAFEEKFNRKIFQKLIVIEILFTFVFAQDLLVSLISQYNFRDGYYNIVSNSLTYHTELYLKNLLIDCEMVIFAMVIFYTYHYAEFETIFFEQPIINIADRKKKKYDELQEKEHEQHETSHEYK